MTCLVCPAGANAPQQLYAAPVAIGAYAKQFEWNANPTVVTNITGTSPLVITGCGTPGGIVNFAGFGALGISTPVLVAADGSWSTVANGVVGAYPGTVTQDITGQTSAPAPVTYTVTSVVPTPPTITSPTDSGSYVNGTAFSDSATTANGTAPITFSLTGAPSGVTINPTTGVPSGTNAVVPGTYAITKVASNGVAPNATQAYNLTVAPKAPVVSFVQGNPTTIVVGSSNCYPGAMVTYTLVGTAQVLFALCGTNVTFTGLGNSLNFNVTATQAFGGVASAVSAAVPVFTTAGTFTNFTVPVTLGSSGTKPVLFSPAGTAPIVCVAAGMPAWLSFNSTTKVFSWSNATPAGSYVVTLTCDNCANNPSVKTYNFVVA
jgi:large repetitive protein